LVVQHSFAVYIVLFKVPLRDFGVLIEGWHGSCITEIIMYYHKDDINVICELLAVKHGDLELDLFSNSVLDAFTEFLCTY